MSYEEPVEVTYTIGEITRKHQRVSISFKEVRIEQARTVKSRRTGKVLLVSDAIVADETGRIILTLWNDDIDSIEEGCCYELHNGRVEIFDESLRLARGYNGVITPCIDRFEILNLDVDMSKPFMGMPSRRRRPRSKEGRTFQGVPGRDQRGYCSEKDF